jgi:hypothetical protein
MAGGIGLSADLSKLTSELKGTDKKFSAAIRKRTRDALAAAGSSMLGDMRSRASWSSRIPGAASVKTTFSATKSKVTVQVDAKKAPHARGLELGNADSFSEHVLSSGAGDYKKRGMTRRQAISAARRTGATAGRALRHPVWGKGWSTMATRPFFFPAASAAGPETTRRMEAALDDIARDAGFK